MAVRDKENWIKQLQTLTQDLEGKQVSHSILCHNALCIMGKWLILRYRYIAIRVYFQKMDCDCMD